MPENPCDIIIIAVEIVVIITIFITELIVLTNQLFIFFLIFLVILNIPSLLLLPLV